MSGTPSTPLPYDPVDAPSGSYRPANDAEDYATTDTTATPQTAATTAKDEATNVAGTAIDSGKKVAHAAKDEAANVAAETKHQAASLFDTVRSEAGQQVSTSQSRIAEAVHGLAKELDALASGSTESGPLTDLAQEASRRGSEVAQWLEDREPADVLESVRSYARRRPVPFLVLCGLAGVVAGRLTRSSIATRQPLYPSQAPGALAEHAYPAGADDLPGSALPGGGNFGTTAEGGQYR